MAIRLEWRQTVEDLDVDTHRIKMKIGSAEFEAEGPKELVTEQFKAFMEAVTAMPVAATASPATASPVAPTVAVQAPAAPEPSTQNGTGVPAQIMERVFAAGEMVSLAALPNSGNIELDSLLALLYGFHSKGEQAVTGTALMRSVEKSGVRVGRIDRCLEKYPDFVLIAGQRKARRYSLNNRGMAKAAEVIKRIVE